MDEFNNNNEFEQFANQGQQPMYNQNTNQFQNPDYVQITEAYSPNYNNYNNNGGRSKKPLIILTIVAVLLLVLAGVAFAAYKFVPGMILSGKDAYFAMEAKSIDKAMKSINEYIDEDYKLMLEKPVKTDMKITAKVDGNIPQQSKAMIETLLKDTSIELKTQSDIKNEYESLELDLTLLGEILNIDYQNDNGMLAVGVKQLYDRYITLDGNNLESLWKALGAQNGPKRIVSTKELLETIELTDEEEKYLNKASDEYMKLVKKNIKEDNFTINKSELLKYNGNEIKCNLVEYRFTQEDAYNVAKAIMMKLKDDDKTLEIIFGKIDKLCKLWEETGYTTQNQKIPSVDEIKEELEKALKSMEDEYDGETKDDVGITIRNYYTNDLTVLKREFITREPDYEQLAKKENNLASIQKLERENKFEIYTINNKNDAYYALAAEDSVIYVDIIKGKQKDEYNIAITQADKETLAFPITVEKVSDVERLIKGELKVPNNDKVKFTFECNLKEEKEKTDFKIDVKITDATQDIDVVLSIEGTSEQNISIEKIDISNAWDIAKSTKAQINNEFNKIQSNLIVLYQKIITKIK